MASTTPPGRHTVVVPLVLMTLLAGCGMKGPLRLPPPPPVDATLAAPPSATAPTAPLAPDGAAGAQATPSAIRP